MSSLSLGAAVLILAAAPRQEPLPFAYALVVGSRNGGPGQSPLRYAAEDAARFGRLLVELGRYAENHVRLLEDPTPEQLLSEFRSLSAELRERQLQGRPTSLLFYYSGHARASGFSLGGQELALETLRNELVAAPADLTIAILDACQSGAFSRIKGVEPAPDFSINSVSQLNTRGLAVMASSTSSELSQESDRLAGSYFTHHLMMAMRGAGDLDGDGRVTLTEAYRYAYARTLIDTAGTTVGSQHATLETDLRGKGEVSLTYPREATASLLLAPELRGDILVSSGESVVGELNKAAGHPIRLGLPPGHYAVIVRRPDVGYDCVVDLVDGRDTPLILTSCVARRLSQASNTNKGEEVGGVFASVSVSKQAGWHFEVRFDAPLTFYVPQGGSATVAAATDASLTYYFQKLVDDQDHALGLLFFLQHPDSISVQPNIQWSSQQGLGSTFGGALSVAVYPWQRTGFTGSLSGGFTSDWSDFGIGLGIQHYFAPTLRLEVGYFGDRHRYVSRGEFPSTSSGSDGGRLGITALWAHEKVYTQLLFTLARLRNHGALPSNGTLIRGNFNTEYFPNRRLSIGAGLEIAELPGYFNGATSSSTFLAVGPLLNAYVGENLLLGAKYTANIELSNVGLRTTLIHSLELSVAWRL